jgi:hypothetical protein
VKHPEQPQVVGRLLDLPMWLVVKMVWTELPLIPQVSDGAKVPKERLSLLRRLDI